MRKQTNTRTNSVVPDLLFIAAARVTTFCSSLASCRGKQTTVRCKKQHAEGSEASQLLCCIAPSLTNLQTAKLVLNALHVILDLGILQHAREDRCHKKNNND